MGEEIVRDVEATEVLVRRTAGLARLEITPEEVRELAAQFARVLEHFRGLASLELDELEPTTGATRLADVLRADEPRPGLPAEALLANAPAREDGFYAVPRTLGEGA